MSESNFNLDEDPEWGMSAPSDEDLVSPHPGFTLIPHPSYGEAVPATAAEAYWFWHFGGWDD